MASEELKQAYTLIKQGEKEKARDLLVVYLEENKNDASGWWLMSNAVNDDGVRRESLERTLSLDPTHEGAQKALRKLDNNAPMASTVEYPGKQKAKPKRQDGTLYQYPLTMRFKIIALAPQVYIIDANDEPVLFVRQKIFNLREDVRIFRDDSKTQEVFRINTDQIIDIGARYHFTDSTSEQSLGSIKQRGLKTIWKAHYDVMPPGSDLPTHELTEDNPWVKVADALLGEIPFLGFFSGYLLHPAYTLHDQNGVAIMQLRKEPSFFERKYSIHLLEPGIPHEEEKRLLLGLMMMVQLNRGRG